MERDKILKEGVLAGEIYVYMFVEESEILVGYTRVAGNGGVTNSV